MDLKIRDKVAIVGGASGGIGSAIAHQLGSEGARLVLWARKAEPLEQSAREIAQATGVEVLTVTGDIREGEDLERIVAATMEKFGQVDILVNNDGAPRLGPLLTFDDETWDKAIRQMLLSVVRLTRLCIPSMKERGWGRVINIGALAGKAPQAGFGLSAATLAGMIGYCKTLSREVGADGITINTLCPGRVDTALTRRALKAQAEHRKASLEDIVAEATARIPVGRFAQPEEIAAVVAFLASEQAAFLTGTALQVDGGTLESIA